jgi:hypothetical protein
MAHWLAIKIIWIKIFDKSNQAYLLLFFSEKYQILVRSWDVCAKGYKSGVPQGSVLSSPFYSLYTNVTPKTSTIYVFFLMKPVYAIDGKEGYVLKKLQRGLSAIEM